MSELKITSRLEAKWAIFNRRREDEGKPPLNFPLWVKVRNRIEAIPESFYQNAWVISRQESPCGTAACLAGEAIICLAPTVERGVAHLKELRVVDKVPAMAAKALGITRDIRNEDEPGEADIFREVGAGWPRPYSSAFRVADYEYDHKEQARIAVEYLDHVIETGKVLE